MLKKIINRKNNLACFILILLGIIILGEFYILQKPKQSIKISPLSVLAGEIIEKCKPTSYHPACYDEEVPKFISIISMEEAFEVTGMIQDQDPSFAYCHVLGHKLSSLETAKDPSKWIDIIPRCPANGMCSNGCLHGALQERFRSESLSDQQIEDVTPDLKITCEARNGWKPTPLDQAICYHGLGHLIMYITDANFEKSLMICDLIGKKGDGRNFSGVCYEGVFMQLFQPLEPEDFALAEGKSPERKKLKDFCTQFNTKQQQQACWEEAWPLYREEVKTAQGIVNFCNNSPNPAQIDHCFEMLFTGAAQNVNFDSKTITKLCSQIPLQRRGQCFASGARGMTQADKKFTDKAIQLCHQAQPSSIDEECFKILVDFSAYDFKSGSEDFLRLCNGLPDPWKDKCLNRG